MIDFLGLNNQAGKAKDDFQPEEEDNFKRSLLNGMEKKNFL